MYMKKAVMIFNPNSGNKNIKESHLLRFQKILEDYDYESVVYTTRYHGHAREIVRDLKEVDLVISIGGDGTFNETMTGNIERKKKLIVTHLPLGTTNDIGAMFGLGKNNEKNLRLLLSGEVKEIDICTVNNHPFIYVAGFGKFMNIPYETPRNLKKRFGYFAYVIEAWRNFVQKTHLYECSYEVDGEKYHGLYSFAIISNANRIAGINNFYKDVKLDDHAFEVLLCNLKTRKDIVKSLFYLKTNDITKVPGFYFHKTNHFKIEFHETLKKSWCIDGEMLEEDTNVFDIKMIRNIKMYIPSKVITRLFVDQKEENNENKLSKRNGKNN